MLISEKENGEGKTEESNDAAKDKVPFGGMHCSCILLCSLCVYVSSLKHRDHLFSSFVRR